MFSRRWINGLGVGSTFSAAVALGKDGSVLLALVLALACGAQLFMGWRTRRMPDSLLFGQGQ